MKKLVFIIAAVISTSTMAGISRNNYVNWVLVASNQTNNSNFIEVINSVEECLTGGNTRIRFPQDDDRLLSLFLTAKTANKKIGFYYSPTTSLPSVSGHGVSTCQITNAWLESN